MPEKKKFCSAVVVAAGKGTRFGSDVPKQFLNINEKPVLYYSLKVLCDSDIIDEIIIVTAEEWIDYVTEEIVRKYDMDKVQAIVLGGEERYDSVFAGLMSVDISSDYVFIHDGARPMLTGEIIQRGFETVSRYQTAVAAVPSADTVKITDEEMVVTSTPDRRNVWRIQTPQIFAYDLILKAYFALSEEDRKGLTDDAMIIERKTEMPVHLFMGSLDNIKITEQGDLDIVRNKLN